MKKYLKDCKNLFPIYGKSERIFLKRLENQIEEYQQSNDVCNYSDLVEQFGVPSSIVSSYYESLDEEQEGLLLKKLNLVKQIRSFLVLFICVVIIALSFKSYLFYLDYKESRSSLIHAIETTIIEEE